MKLAETLRMLEATGRPLEDRVVFQGLQVSIENKKGSTRSGVNKEGKKWSTTMVHPYGYIKGTLGVDGDHHDVFIGPNLKAEYAYIVHTKCPQTGDYDEDKTMLGFDSADEAKAAFLENYDDPRFFGSMTSMPMDEFKEKVLETRKQVPHKRKMHA